MSQEEYRERRMQAIRRGAQQGGAAGAKQAEKNFNESEKKRRIR